MKDQGLGAKIQVTLLAMFQGDKVRMFSKSEQKEVLNQGSFKSSGGNSR